MKQVFLHIGIHKTGTTSLQTFLHTNKKHLAKLGYLYPSKRIAHHNLSYILMGDSRADYQSNTWEEIINEIETRNLAKVIISSEAFLESGKIEFIQQVAEKFKNYQTKIIIYIKRQDKRAESALNHNIKVGEYTGSIDLFLQERGKTDYLKILDDWSQVFGQENIIVRPLEKEQIPNLYQDFLRNIGIANINGFEQIEEINVKPNLAQIIALNFINQKIISILGLKEEGFHKLNRQNKDLFVKNYRGKFLQYTKHWQSKTNYNLIPYERSIEILQQCQKNNAEIAKRYLNCQNGQLFHEPLNKYDCESLDINNLDREYLIDLASYIFHIFKID